MIDFKSKFKSQFNKKSESEPEKRKLEALKRLKKCLHLLVKNISHSNYQVRKCSVQTLVSFNNDSLINFLSETYKQDNLSDYLSLALGKISTEQTLTLLLESLADENHEIRWQAAQALGQAKDKRALTTLLESLQFYFQKDPSQNSGIIQTEPAIISTLQALAQLKDRRSLPVLKQIFLKEKNPKIKATAAITLATIDSSEIFEIALIGIKDSDPRVQANSLEILQGHGRSYEKEIKHLLQSENNRVSGNTAMILYPVCKSEVQKHLWEMFEGFDKWPRCTAIFVMGQTKDNVFFLPIKEKLLKDSDSDVRRNCANALKGYADAEASMDLINAFSREESVPNKLAITDAMTTCLKFEHRNQVIHLLEEEREAEIIARLINCLIEIGDRETLKVIQNFLNHKKSVVCLSALRFVKSNALVVQREPILPKLKLLIRHPDPKVRILAIQTLWDWGESSVIDDILNMLNQSETEEIILATEVLQGIGRSLNFTLEELGINQFHKELEELFEKKEEIDKKGDAYLVRPFSQEAATIKADLDLLLKKEKFLKAIELLEKIATIEPDNDEWNLKIASLAKKIERPHMAIQSLLRIVKRNPSFKKQYYILGKLFFDLHEYKNASRFLLKTIQLYPELLEAHYMLADALFYCGLHEKERAILKLIQLKDSKNLLFIKRFIRSGLEKNQTQKEAEQMLISQLKANPNDQELRFMLAQLYYLKGEQKSFPALLKIISNSRRSDISYHFPLFSVQRIAKGCCT